MDSCYTDTRCKRMMVSRSSPSLDCLVGPFCFHDAPFSSKPMSSKPIATTALIETRGLGRHYDFGNVDALVDVTLSIPPGDYVAVVGKSGSGKTTLLNLIGGLDRPTAGELFFDGERIDPKTNLDQHRCRNVGFVFQNYYLLPNLTATENVQTPMFETEASGNERRERANRLLETVGLAGREHHFPSQLSGGECQRVAVARALANCPKVILADEPTGALDSESGTAIIELLERLRRDDQLTLIVVTHDETLAGRAERLVRMVDGRIHPRR